MAKPTEAQSFEKQIFVLVLAELAGLGVPADEAVEIAKIYAQSGAAAYA